MNPVPEILIRASCPLCGGLGGCYEEMCGVLSAGILLLGCLWGRVSWAESDDLVCDLACQFRERFIAFSGSSQCKVIRASLDDEPKRCAPIVAEGARLLVELIEQQAKDTPFRRT